MATNTYIPLATYTIPTATSSYTFSSISSAYTDLVLVCSVKLDIGGSYSMGLQFNGDTASNYSWTGLIGNGTTASSQRGSNVTYAIYGTGNTDWGNSIVNIMNYANATTYKTCVARNNNTADSAQAWVNLWRSTAAINSVKVMSQSGSNFVAGTTFSLYGILAESSAQATGGYVTSDANYYYHTFLASGTFTPLSTLSCDVLVVAGGGGGGAEYYVGDGPGGGGGGAGGFRLLTSQSITATAKTVTVGAGGAGSPIAFSPSYAGSSGVNSSVSGAALTTITGSGGGGGASYNTVPNGVSGGSGGGGTYSSGTGGAGNTGSYSPVEGYAGGIGNNLLSGAGGGGGGAGAVGAAAASNTGGAGGIGAGGTGYTNYAIIDAMGAATGTGQLVSSNYYYAGGGGGSGKNTAGAGGYGGGATNLRTSVAVNATANTGGGGAGSYYLSAGVVGGAGGSGIVIVRYAKV